MPEFALHPVALPGLLWRVELDLSTHSLALELRMRDVGRVQFARLELGESPDLAPRFSPPLSLSESPLVSLAAAAHGVFYLHRYAAQGVPVPAALVVLDPSGDLRGEHPDLSWAGSIPAGALVRRTWADAEVPEWGCIGPDGVLEWLSPADTMALQAEAETFGRAHAAAITEATVEYGDDMLHPAEAAHWPRESIAMIERLARGPYTLTVAYVSGEGQTGPFTQELLVRRGDEIVLQRQLRSGVARLAPRSLIGVWDAALIHGAEQQLEVFRWRAD